MYKHVLFDLDHTLWDFHKNASETLEELHQEFLAERYPDLRKEQFIDTFHAINLKLWHALDNKHITKELIRSTRFPRVFEQLGITVDARPERIEDEYMQRCCYKPHVFPYTFEVLEYLSKNYSLHIVTNGFDEVQFIKMNSSRLTDHFEEVVTPERAGGHRKPSREIFSYTMNRIKATPEQCIMIGDNLETDIKGAQSASIADVLFNPERHKHDARVKHEIHCLSELKKIL